jgi:hypothetical protein
MLICISLFYSKIHLRYCLTADSVVTISTLVTFMWLLCTLRFIQNNNIKIKQFIEIPKKKQFILEFPCSFVLTYMGGMGFILIMLFIIKLTSLHILSLVNSTISPKS